MHMACEDGIYAGFNKELGWDRYLIENPEDMKNFGACYEIEETTLRSLALDLKKKLCMETVQIAGNQ